MSDKEKVVVIGSGVIGMATAICLSAAGYQPVVMTKERYLETTSAVAAAFWYPYKAEPLEKTAGWGQRSLSIYKELIGHPDAGILWSEIVEYFLPGDELPWWHLCVEGFSDEGLVDLPYGKRRRCRYSIPIVDTSIYLRYLDNLLKEHQIEVIIADFSSIDEAFAYGNTVVNCSGIGAIKLAKDDDLHAARGQVVRIKNDPALRAAVDLTREPKIAHVTPRVSDTILGGTYEEHVYDLNPVPAETKAIIQRCQDICPELAGITEADILGVACGLRPVRSSVRVERELVQVGVKNAVLLHNYGHGGAGYTLAWGCAEEICAMLHEATL